MAEPGPLRYAVIEITNRCNLRCRHCASTSGAARAGEFTLAEIRTVIADIRALGGEEVTIIGGEALLRPDWRDICTVVREQGMRLLLITNGLLLRAPEDFAALRDLAPYLVGVSLDGATPASYQTLRGVDGFAHTLAVLRRLRDDGHPQVNAITTFFRANLREFDDFARLFDGSEITWQVQIANRGGARFGRDDFLDRQDYAWLTRRMRDVYVERPDTLHLAYMDDFGYFPIDPKLRFLHQTWGGCIAGVELVGIRSNGDVLGCLSLADPFVETNLRQVPLAEVWQSGRFFTAFREKERHLVGECAACPFGQRCRAGCSAIAWSATGSLGCNPYCIRSLEIAEVLAGA